jgi:predicted PurR-regulated permease PerM
MVELPRAEQCREWMPFLKKRTQDDVLFLGAEFLKIIIAFFRGQLLVALSQGVLYAIGFILAGLQYGLVLA